MNRLSCLLWLATLLLLNASSGSYGQADTPQAIQIDASGWEWGQSATLPRPLAQYALDRPVTEPAVVRGGEPLCIIASKANRPALWVEMQPGPSLIFPHDLIIELPRDVLTRLLTAGVSGQPPQHGTGQVIVLMVLISNVCEKTHAGRILQCSPLVTEVWAHDKDLALTHLHREPHSGTKQEPTKRGNYAGRSAQHFTRYYDWLLPELE